MYKVPKGYHIELQGSGHFFKYCVTYNEERWYEKTWFTDTLWGAKRKIRQHQKMLAINE